MKKTALLLIPLLLAALAAGYLLLGRDKPVRVAVQAVEKGAVEATVANTRAGSVKARQRARLAPAIGGQIATLNVHKSDTVKAGQVLLTVAVHHPPRQLSRLLPPDGTQPTAILKRLDPRTTLRPPPPAGQRHQATGADQVRPREAKRFQGVLYSWTTKDGRRAYSNTGFPRDGEYFDAQIEYSK